MTDRASINALKERKVDFRLLINLKTRLFDSPLADGEGCLPTFAFQAEVDRIDSAELKECLAASHDALMDGIAVGDSVNLNKFSQLVDLYEYLPSAKAESLNKSPQIHQVLSSNTRDKATHERPQQSQAEIQLHQNLEVLGLKFDERFKSIKEAYLYYDQSQNNRIMFNEFCRCNEALKIKLSTAQQLEVFRHLAGDKNFINF